MIHNIDCAEIWITKLIGYLGLPVFPAYASVVHNHNLKITAPGYSVSICANGSWGHVMNDLWESYFV